MIITKVIWPLLFENNFLKEEFRIIYTQGHFIESCVDKLIIVIYQDKEIVYHKVMKRITHHVRNNVRLDHAPTVWVLSMEK